MMYPLSEFDGQVKSRDWINLPKATMTSQDREEEVKWGIPQSRRIQTSCPRHLQKEHL
jgi:hypothetical protein